MTNEKWRTAWELYRSARELPAPERAILLKAVDTEPDVLQEVVSLLDEAEEQLLEAEREDQTPLAGFDIGRYAVVEYLGKGGMSEVYSARDRQLGRAVALKFLLPGTIAARSADRVMREAKTLSGLNHPNIVTVYEVIQSAAGLAIVMELVEGASLRSLCGTPLPQEQVALLGQQIAQALRAAHAHGIVHRDIKPENILLRPDGYVKVVDFGLARQLATDDLTSLYGLTMGTLRYMSPEQVRGESLSPASDVFSLGLVLYELAAGKHPFSAESSAQIAYSIATNRAAPLPHAKPRMISSRLEQLILAMLAKDPAQRPSAADVAKELGQVQLLSGKPATIVSSSSKRRLWLSALVACLVAIAAATWLLLGRRDDRPFEDLKIEPLTSQTGWELDPALSPDGQSVAFTWSDRLDGTNNIYVKRISDANPVKLTNHSEGLVGYLAWSPDGKRIAFKYSGKAYGKLGGSLYSIPAGGGQANKLFDLANANLSSSIDWSPDGTELAFSDATPGTQKLAIYLLDLRTGKTRRLTSPPVEKWGDWNPKFSPDGSTIAFKRVTGFWLDDLYLVARRGGAPRRLTATQRGFWGHVWWPDGKSLIVSCQRNGSIFGIWRFPLAPGAQPERISVGAIDAIAPTTGRKTNRMAWVNQLWDLNIYRVAVTGEGTPRKLIASTLRDQGATYSPDGRIAFISDRSGSREIWLANQDGSGQVRVTNFNGPPVDCLQWSPDGRQLAFESQANGQTGVFVLRCDPGSLSCGEPRRVTSPSTPAESPAWSLDGRHVYFASSRTGRWEIWKEPESGGQMTQETHQTGYTARESPDGKWLYFSKPEIEAIYRRPVSAPNTGASSDTQRIIGPPYRVQPGGWAITRNEIIFIDRATPDRSAVIRAYNPATRTIRSILSLNEIFADRSDIGLSVSPDEKWILYSQLDRSGSNIMLAESREEK